MGIKSTTKMTRQTAEERYAEIAAEMAAAQARSLARAEAALMGDTELEDALEAANDLRAKSEGTVGFDNYLIVSEDVLREEEAFRP